MPVAWDYENDKYYHIYACSGPLEDILSDITIEMPQTNETDDKIQAIVSIFNEIEI